MKIYHVSETTPGEQGESVLLTCHKIKSYCYSRLWWIDWWSTSQFVTNSISLSNWV